MGEGEEVEGKPLAFGQLSVELLAVPAPDRTGEPVARNCFGPHPACPVLNHLRYVVETTQR